MLWPDIRTSFELLIGGGTIGWAIWRYAFFPYAVRPMKRMIGDIRALPSLRQQNADILRQLDGMSKTLGEALSELRPNGGASLRDAVNRLDAKVETSLALTRGLISAGDMIVEFDQHGHLASISRNALRILERSESELLGNNWMGCLRQSQRAGAEAEMASAVREGRDINLQLDFGLPDGGFIPVHLSARVVRGPLGKISCWVGTLVAEP